MTEQNYEQTNGNLPGTQTGALEGEAVAATLDEAAATNGAASDGSAEASSETLIQQLEQEIAAEKARYEELNDRFQRTSAEFQNTLRRRERQATETIERASQHIVLRLLPVLDDLDRGFQNLPAELAETQVAWLDGFRQIQKKLQTVLEEEGVTTIPLDGAFDPTLHEAVTSEASEEVPSGHIIATLRIGYQQRGRVIRPALVRVAA